MCADVGFLHNGTLLSNNSVMLFSDIGEGGEALYCLTERIQCCSAESGQWRLPDNSAVSENTSSDLYQGRGASFVALKRRSNVMSPTGVYTCMILDSMNVLRTLSIGLYDIGKSSVV